MEVPLILLGCTIFLCIIGLVSYRRSNFFRVTNNIIKTPYKVVSAVEDDEIVKIIGRIRLQGDPLIAPLSKRPCAYYFVQVQQEKSGGESSSWTTIATEKNLADFIIQTPKGNAKLSKVNLKSYTKIDQKYSSGFLNDPTRHLREFLEEHSIESTGFLGFNKNLRYREAILTEGELVAIAGQGIWKDKVLHIHAPQGSHVYMSNHDSVIPRTS